MKNSRGLAPLIFSIILAMASCQSKSKIIALLESQEKDDIIKGAYLAGESGDKEFIPFLLSGAWDFRRSTNFQFKGYSIYEEKMIALKKIFGKAPPVEITYMPDSTVIDFYIRLSKKDH